MTKQIQIGASGEKKLWKPFLEYLVIFMPSRWKKVRKNLLTLKHKMPRNILVFYKTVLPNMT